MTNPFAIFDFPVQWDLDQKALHTRFVAASSRNHPDRHTDPLDQGDAAQRAAEINEAYQTLRDDEGRANALLEILGGPGKSEDKSLPPHLLMQMMEVREEMEEAIADDDAATVSRLAAWADEQRMRHVHRVGELLTKASRQDSTKRGPTLQEARLELNALRYFQRMLQQIP